VAPQVRRLPLPPLRLHQDSHSSCGNSSNPRLPAAEAPAEQAQVLRALTMSKKARLRRFDDQKRLYSSRRHSMPPLYRMCRLFACRPTSARNRPTT
jgi:hypothetical protein